MFETISQIVPHVESHYPKSNLIEGKSDGRYRPISTGDFLERIRSLTLGLLETGLKPGDRVALLAPNSPDWIATDLAVICCGAVTVPIYPTLTPEQILYILNDSQACMVVYSDAVLWEKLESIRGQAPRVREFIRFSGEAPENVRSLPELESAGRAAGPEAAERFARSVQTVKPKDLASIIYTSGTTGNPKGVMLSHANFVSDILALRSIVEFTDRDKCLSFLPLSHVLERMCTFAFLSQGTSIAYAESVETVAENLLETRPTIMVSVPRLFEKIYAGVLDNVLLSSPLKRKLFFWAMGVGKKFGRLELEGKPIPAGLRLRKALAGRLVFNRILERTGGRIRFFVSGGAPLAKDIAEFFYALGLTILEGYGLTETSPVISVNTFEKLRFGSVGPSIPGIDVKIADDGEILVRGPIVMQGYNNLEEETRKAFSGDWFHTGDIGYLDDDGFLYVTDRKKDLIVTSGGKNVAPQVLENLVRMNPYVSGVVVVGARRKFISAVIVPDFVRLEEYARSHNIPFGNFEELVADSRILDFYMKEIDLACRGLAPFERIKKIVLLPRDFELEAGEVTPTLKIRRHIVEEKYRREIDRLYS